MSSSGEKKTFSIGAHVDATDGRCGSLIRLIVDPTTQSLTHLAVQPGHHEERTRLVPADLVAGVEDEVIRLSCTTKQFDQLDAAEDIELLSSADLISTQSGIGAALPTGHHSKPRFSDVVPTGAVAVRRGDAVHAKDGWIGAVDGLVIDPASEQVTHVILQEGHLWGRKHVAIPIGTANRVENQIRVDLTKKEIEALPPGGSPPSPLRPRVGVRVLPARVWPAL
jgi:sporulation protein YlmC with PRC-barrel domain